MITTKTKDGTDILINETNIIYASPTRDNGVVVYFKDNTYIVIGESFLDLKARFEPVVATEKTVMEILGIPDSQTNTADLYKDLDQYPAHLPRLPTGYVDKRTTAYKEYVASL
jgi:hypothetical protein